MDSYRIFFAAIGSRRVIWELYLDDIELLVGMLAVGTGIIEDLNASSTRERYYVDSDADVSLFRLLPDVPEDIVRSSSAGQIKPGYYGIWLKGMKRFHYSLYTFRTNSFFQGIVSMAATFNVDFRNYLYGFPFDMNGNQYALSGYIMTSDQVGVDAPDLDDIEEEEEDDENINEPLSRTDDIITLRD